MKLCHINDEWKVKLIFFTFTIFISFIFSTEIYSVFSSSRHGMVLASSDSDYLKKNSIKFAEFGDRPYFSDITKTALLSDLYNSCDPLQILTVQDYCN